AEGRLQGGGADPNYFAAGLVPALVLAVWMATAARRIEWKFMAIIGAVVLIVGIGATQSRGALIGTGAAALAALIVFNGRRPQVALLLVLLVSVGGIYFSLAPSAWNRVTSYGGGGTGRADVWTVAWRLTEDHPFAGIGLGNFRDHSAQYVRRPGQLHRVDIIVGRQPIVHNTYLQVLSETGVVGLLGFVSIAGVCLAALLRAAYAFGRAGNYALQTLSRSVFVGTVGLLVASFFITNGSDKRLWILL